MLDEQCDDGDIEPGDGCSEVCEIETGWSVNEVTDPDTGHISTTHEIVCGD